jgi:hypothetical protein
MNDSLTLLQAHRVETTLTQNGTLTLEDLPFQAGEAVEVIVQPTPSPVNSSPGPSQNRYPLRGTPIHYPNPTDPVAEQDWEALS